MEKICEICKRKLNKKLGIILIKEEIVDSPDKLEFEKKLNEYRKIYNFIGSCFYCDARRLTALKKNTKTP